MATCGVCFRHCTIPEGQLGFCGGRTARDGRVEAYNYGRITSLALDPIEKKPFKRFFPGSLILSVGSFGCNLRCPFCQNHEISWSEQARALAKTAETVSPEELVDLALRTRSQGNIGIAFTYNEPLIGYEFVRNTARLAKAEGLKNVMVTNGTAELAVLEELSPYIDAMNIDLKGFTDRYYSKVLSGDRQQVMAFIEAAVKTCHVELTKTTEKKRCGNYQDGSVGSETRTGTASRSISPGFSPGSICRIGKRPMCGSSNIWQGSPLKRWNMCIREIAELR